MIYAQLVITRLRFGKFAPADEQAGSDHERFFLSFESVPAERVVGWGLSDQ